MPYHTTSEPHSHTLWYDDQDGTSWPVAGSKVSELSVIYDFISAQGQGYLKRIGHLDELLELLKDTACN